jgi:hypothetical protein
MGYSTALIPMRETEDGMILWHLEMAKDYFQLKVSDLEATQQQWLQTKSLDYLQSKIALLGWCREANILLGTDQLDASVAWSDAQVKPFTWHWKDANLQALAQTASPIQMGGQVGFSFERAPNRLRYDPSEMYIKCLQNSTLEQIVIYDVNAKRAWLVSLISVLRHMLLAYCHVSGKDSRGISPPIAVSTSGGSPASLETLRDNGEVVLQGSGNHKLTIAQLVLKFSINMSRVSSHNTRKSKIYGYEFMDIVMDSLTSELKEKHLEKEGLAWSSLLGGVYCLFCSGLGEAIVGRRALSLHTPCNSLPTGHDFLAATMKSIELLSMRHGGSTKGGLRRLSHSHFWRLSGSPFQKCIHREDWGSCWDHPDFLQEIHTQQSQGSEYEKHLDDSTNGALVFGTPVKRRKFELALRLQDLYQSQSDSTYVPAQQRHMENSRPPPFRLKRPWA